MNRFKIFTAAAILSLMFASPVFAQAAIQEPGLFAFYYPNNDVLNGGRPTPAAGPDARTPVMLAAAARLPPWTASQMVLLAGSGTVPMIPLQGRSLEMTVAGTSASERARRIK